TAYRNRLAASVIEQLKSRPDELDPALYAPVWVSGDTASVNENATGLAYRAQASLGSGSGLSYSIAGGADKDSFTIDAITGELYFKTSPNYEAPTDVDRNNVYVVQIGAQNGRHTISKTVTISVGNINEFTPSWTSGGNIAVNENVTGVISTVHASDGDGQSITYSIVGGTDASAFTINAATGALQFKTAPNYEAPHDQDGNNGYALILRASDGTRYNDKAFSVSVGNINEFTPSWTSGGNIAVNENVTGVISTVHASDGDGQSITYSIVGGADAGAFTINATTGALQFKNSPDFENPHDQDGNNGYVIVLRASDGTRHNDKTFSVKINNVNEFAPSWNSGTDISVNENFSGIVYVPNATDGDGGAVTYSIIGGEDAGNFQMDATGKLSFKNPPNADLPGDANGDNIYRISLRASDGTRYADQILAISVTNENDNAPIFTSPASHNTNEGSLNTGYRATATDGDGNPLTFSIVGGYDAADFTINTSTGA
ncbi:cadherin repeat domain-containing protein, partial [Woodsholea maritima]|uniref:cadherin repeat domain-containing protein n=1 Tax=Woodsholea maritima TaxID=240237 RepID=UPI0004784412